MANITSKTEDTSPASDDWLYIVDISDTTDNANGSDKKATPANVITKSHGLTGTELLKLTSGVIGKATADTDYQSVPSEGAFVDGDKTKLDGIETAADVTDATNVDAAGAVMNSDTSTASMSFVVDEDDMASDSATKVPTQQSVKAYVDANAGGGGSSTPRIEFPLIGAANSLDDSTQGKMETVNSGTSSSIQFSATSGTVLQNGTTTTGYAYVRDGSGQRAGRWYATNWFDLNPTFQVRFASYEADNGGHHFIVGGSQGADDGTAFKLFGFAIKKVSGTTTIYAVNGNGTSETRTDVTTAVQATTGWNTAGTKYDQILHIEMTSGTSIKFYVNGTLVATHTTNLPSGSLVTSYSLGIQCARIESNAGTTASSILYLLEMKSAIDAY